MSVTLLINAVDKTADCIVGSAEFTQPVKGFRGTSRFTIRQLPTGTPYTPVRGHSVQWKDGSVVVFRGTIDTYDKKPMVDTGGGFFYDITAVSPEQRIDKRFVTRAFPAGTTCGAIVSSILSTELADEGIPAGTISAGTTLDIAKVYDHARISDVFTELASLCDDFTWYIDPSDGELYFQQRTTVPAPFTVDDGEVLASTGAFVSYSRNEYRNTQHVKINETNLVPEVQTFDGNGTTDSFTLNKAIRDIVSIRLTTATSSTIVGTFNSTPVDGDAITIGGWQYMFMDVLPPPQNVGYFTQAVNYVLIGRGNLGTLLADTVTNLVACLIDNGDGKGTYYSSTSIKNQALSDAVDTGSPPTTFEVTLTSLPGGYFSATTSGAFFTWGEPTALDDGTSSFQTFVERSQSTTGAAEYQWVYNIGGTTIEQMPGQTPPQTGEQLVVEYKPIGFGVVTVDDIAEIEARAAAEGGSGIYENLAIREDLMTVDAGIAAAQALLLANINMTERVTFDTDTTGLLPGQYVTINDTALGVNADYLIQSVTATIPPTYPWTWRYRVLAVSGTQTTIEAWAALANKGTPNGISSIGGSSKLSPQEVTGVKSAEIGIWEANFGLDDDTVGTHPIQKYVPVKAEGVAFMGYVTVNVIGATETVLDVLFSSDGGETWTSIFGPNNSDKIVIPAEYLDQDVYFSQNPRIRPITNFAERNLKKGWLLRLDSLVSGGATGITVYIAGKPSGSRGQQLNYGSPGIAPLVLLP